MPEQNPNDIDRPFVLGDELRRPLDQPAQNLPRDIDQQDTPTGGSKFAAFAVAVAVMLGALFYGLNNSSMNPVGTATTQGTAATTTAKSNSAQPVAPNVRDVTPRNNSEPGVTTGAAPPRPSTPPAKSDLATPTGGNMPN